MSPTRIDCPIQSLAKLIRLITGGGTTFYSDDFDMAKSIPMLMVMTAMTMTMMTMMMMMMTASLVMTGRSVIADS